MIDDHAYGATVAKRRLARRLAALRVRAGMSLNEASDKLGWSRGRLNRFEANQWRQPDPSHIRDLARIYGTSDSERAELEDLVTLARARMWWHEPEKEKEKVFSNEFAGFENDAARISVYMPLLIPACSRLLAALRRIWLSAGHHLTGVSGRWRRGCAASRSSTAPTAPRRGWSRWSPRRRCCTAGAARKTAAPRSRTWPR